MYDIGANTKNVHFDTKSKSYTKREHVKSNLKIRKNYLIIYSIQKVINVCIHLASGVISEPVF